MKIVIFLKKISKAIGVFFERTKLFWFIVGMIVLYCSFQYCCEDQKEKMRANIAYFGSLGSITLLIIIDTIRRFFAKSV